MSGRTEPAKNMKPGERVPRKAQTALLRRASAADRELDTLSLLINIHEGEVVLHAGQKCNAMAGIAETFELDPKFWIGHIVACNALD